MKIVFSTLVFVLATILTFSQTHLSSGYLIKNSGDTLYGEIGETYLQEQVKLELLDSVETRFYDPSEIKEFYFANGEYYQVFLNKEVDDQPDFYRCVLKGTISLYVRTDNLTTEHYYFKMKDGAFKELIQRDTIYWARSTGGSLERVKRKQNFYYNVISAVFLDCPQLLSKMNNYDYDLIDFEKALIDYHQCTGIPYKSYNRNDSENKYRTDFGIAFSPEFKTTLVGDGGASEVIRSPGYSIGFHSNFFLSAKRQNFSVEIDVIYTRYNYEESWANGYSDKQLYTGISYPVMLNTYYRLENSAFYFGGGLVFGQGFGIQAGYEHSLFDRIIVKTNIRTIGFETYHLNFVVAL
jgi:hypothetical protein